MKIQITKAELVAKLLARIREYEGCEGVQWVDLEPSDIHPDCNWNLAVVGPGATDWRAIEPASVSAFEELSEQYDLATVN